MKAAASSYHCHDGASVPTAAILRAGPSYVACPPALRCPPGAWLYAPVQAAQTAAFRRLFTYQDGLGGLRQSVHQNVGMRCNDDLHASGGVLQEFRDGGQNVRVQTEFRFLNADQRRRRGVQQNRRQAQITQRAVRQAGGRDGVPAFLKKDLDSASLHTDIIVLNTAVELAESFEKLFLGVVIPAQAVQDEGKVAGVRLKPVIGQVGLLGLTGDGIAPECPPRYRRILSNCSAI